MSVRNSLPTDSPPSHPSRRRFLQGAGAGAMLLTVSAGAATRHAPAALAAGSAEALLLTCIDYRLIAAAGAYMDGRQLTGRYDQLILAGASLGAQTDLYPAWQQTFLDHLDLAVQLHGISRVILLDHRDCAAYTLVFGQDLALDPATETVVHAQQLALVRNTVATAYPGLAVETLLMALDGSVQDTSTL